MSTLYNHQLSAQALSELHKQLAEAQDRGERREAELAELRAVLQEAVRDYHMLL